MKDSIFGSALLIAGCCIGAGMIGLPIASLKGGFIPSTLMIVLAYIFTTVTGLLLAEATMESPVGSNLLTVTEERLGKKAKIAVALLFAALFYALFTAFFEGVAALISDFFRLIIGSPLERKAALLLSFAFIFTLTCRSMRQIDWINRALLFGLLLGYCGLVLTGIPHINPQNLLGGSLSASLMTLPILFICFGYHNLVPSIVTYLKRDRRSIQKAIILGNMIPLGVYLIWNLVILGLVDSQEKAITLEGHGAEAVLSLLSAVSETALLGIFASLFTGTALLSSFIPSALSFADFLKDGLSAYEPPFLKHRAIHLLIALLPPLLFSLLVPNLFMTALNFAGGVVVVLLYGLLPPLLVYRNGNSPLKSKTLLLTVGVFALFVLAITLCR